MGSNRRGPTKELGFKLCALALTRIVVARNLEWGAKNIKEVDCATGASQYQVGGWEQSSHLQLRCELLDFIFPCLGEQRVCVRVCARKHARMFVHACMYNKRMLTLPKERDRSEDQGCLHLVNHGPGRNKVGVHAHARVRDACTLG